MKENREKAFEFIASNGKWDKKVNDYATLYFVTDEIIVQYLKELQEIK